MIKLLILAIALYSSICLADSEKDDHVRFNFAVSKLEKQYNGENNPGEWDAHIRFGDRLNKIWLVSEGQTESNALLAKELRLFYSRTLTPDFGMQIGWRRETQPAQRDWLEIGVLGFVTENLATDTVVYLGESGRTALRLHVGYPMYLHKHPFQKLKFIIIY